MKETGPSYGKKFVCSDNSGQNVWQKVKRYNKIGQGFKNVISNFACFLTVIVNVSFLEGRKGIRLYPHPHLTFF